MENTKFEIVELTDITLEPTRRVGKKTLPFESLERGQVLLLDASDEDTLKSIRARCNYWQKQFPGRKFRVRKTTSGQLAIVRVE